MTEKRRVIFDEDDFRDVPETSASQSPASQLDIPKLPPVPPSHPLADGAERPTATAGSYRPAAAPPPVAYVQQPYIVKQKTNGLAIASLVLGILWIYWLGSLLALIFGLVAKSQIDNSGGSQNGRGLAIAGIVLGIVGLGIFLLLLIVGASIVGSA